MADREVLLSRLQVWIDNNHRGRPIRIAIDGPEGAGRTTFAADVERHLRETGRRLTRLSVEQHQDALLFPEEALEKDSILIVDGAFVLRPELREHWDIRIHLRVDTDELGSAHDIYVEQATPEHFSEWIIDNTDPRQPRLIRFPEGAFQTSQQSSDVYGERRRSFRAAGVDYDRARPGYPVDALCWLTGDEPVALLDLGCGPGKLTSQATALGHRAVGLDPSESMLRVARSKNVLAVCGAAEAIPLRTAAFDVVTAAQAFHWFKHEDALPEIHRVIRSGGHLGLLWNLRSEKREWVRELSKIIGSEAPMSATLGLPDRFEDGIESKLRYGDLFSSIEHRLFDLEQKLDEDGLVALIKSRSYMAILPDSERETILDSVRDLCRTHPDLTGKPSFSLPYVTHVFRARAT